MSCRLLFVYGTLLRRSPHPMARFLEEHAIFLGEATVAGRLYDLGPYPALLTPMSADDVVHGELFELRDSESTLRALDVYEGLGVAAAEDWPFQRRRTHVRGADGQAGDAWVYLYTRPVDEGQRIASGKYFGAGR